MHHSYIPPRPLPLGNVVDLFVADRAAPPRTVLIGVHLEGWVRTDPTVLVATLPALGVLDLVSQFVRCPFDRVGRGVHLVCLPLERLQQVVLALGRLVALDLAEKPDEVVGGVLLGHAPLHISPVAISHLGYREALPFPEGHPLVSFLLHLPLQSPQIIAHLVVVDRDEVVGVTSRRGSGCTICAVLGSGDR